jgi:hypothetical protein
MKNKHGKRDLRFSLYPAGGVETASSRLRVYTIQAALEKRGVHSIYGYSIKSNVFFIQKKVTLEILIQAKIAKILGGYIIYDVDDLGDALWYWTPKKYFEKMLRLADIVITGSQSQLNYLLSLYNIKQSAVIFSTIDYFPTEPVRLLHRNREKLRVIWFGSESNFNMFAKYIDLLLKITDIEIIVVSSKSWIDMHAKKFNDAIIFYPWSLCGFVSMLQTCDLAFLMHDGQMEDRAKSNNKMIASITWGVPAVVSRTPEYERTAREIGIEYAVFSDESDLSNVIERLRPAEARNQYLETAQPAIWDLYSPEVIADKYIEIART